MQKVLRNPVADYDVIAEVLFSEILHMQAILDGIALGVGLGMATPDEIITLLRTESERVSPKIQRVIDQCREDTEQVRMEYGAEK